ncbi:hypothetical protein AB0F96_09125 [Streptomyces sp. NPDC023998]|uniref:hypothetical protein n=1 Tax=Streptomyces sp. NPDC023998 TaxID=3154597 RepID=UPI0033E8201D
MRRLFAAFAPAALLVTLLAAPAAAESNEQPNLQRAAATHTETAPSSAPSAAAGLRKLYDVEFFVGERVSANQIRKLRIKPVKAWNELHRCFNCSFPVKGAPKKFPTEGQLIKLKACAAGSWGCKPAPVRYYKSGWPYSWCFVAQKGHFDGAGSKVFFRFFNDSSGYLKLNVWAYVTKPTVPDSLNKEFATSKWRAFSHVLGMNLG